MRPTVTIILSIVAILAGCRTTGSKGGSAQIYSFGDEESIAKTREEFVAVINQCTPMILALAPGGSKGFDISRDAAKQAVVRDFVNKVVQEPKTPFETSARLAKYHHEDKQQEKTEVCNTAAAEYLLFTFALRSNVLTLPRDSNADLKISM